MNHDRGSMKSDSGETQNNADKQTSMGESIKRVTSVNDGRNLVKLSHLFENDEHVQNL